MDENVYITPVIRVIPLVTIIVGQGWRSIEGNRILKETVLNLLQVEYGIDAVMDDHHPGTSNHLRRFLAKRNWYG
jgi:hypothetical protein